MNSELAINTIKESCYQVGYPTHDKEHERRKLINQSYDYAIECIKKINKINQIYEQWAEIGDNADCWAFREIGKVLDKE